MSNENLSALDYGHYEGEVNNAIKTEDDTDLTLTESSPIEIDVKDIYLLPNDQYALLRKQGIGASDASIVLGVNPYKTVEELIQEKVRQEITEEERAVGQKDAVRKGRDLEPLIIKKFQDYFGIKMMKPPSQYVFKKYPWLKINFDGVTFTPEQYIPVEIKVATYKGVRHYNTMYAIFNEFKDQHSPKPPPPEDLNYAQRAEYYGMPEYYYPQVQQQMLGVNAPYGYLAVLFEQDWSLHVFQCWADKQIQNDIIIKSQKVWEEVERRKQKGQRKPQLNQY
jgi:putative phage-type endonuclease